MGDHKSVIWTKLHIELAHALDNDWRTMAFVYLQDGQGLPVASGISLHRCVIVDFFYNSQYIFRNMCIQSPWATRKSFDATKKAECSQPYENVQVLRLLSRKQLPSRRLCAKVAVKMLKMAVTSRDSTLHSKGSSMIFKVLKHPLVLGSASLYPQHYFFINKAPTRHCHSLTIGKRRYYIIDRSMAAYCHIL